MKSRAKKNTVLRPGEDGWQSWTFRSGALPVCEKGPFSVVSGVVAAIPTRDLVALPLWLPESGDTRELAELELSSRHLLRRGMEVQCLLLETVGARSLVLAMASGECPGAPEAFAAATRFEASARTLPADGAGIVIWREEGSPCFALYRGQACVFFSGGSADPGSLCGAIKRALLRLRFEKVIEDSPKLVRLYGRFPEIERQFIAGKLGIPLEYSEIPPPPTLPVPATDIPPPSVRERRLADGRQKRAWRMAAVGGLAYLALLGIFGAVLATDMWKAHGLRAQAAALETPASAARKEITRWREIRSAVDPRMFALDLLAAVAAQLSSDQVRLTVFSLESGRLSLAGEAPSVPLAYAFIENIRQSPALADFDWTASQPQLAGRQMVRFEMEGRPPDAQVIEE